MHVLIVLIVIVLLVVLFYQSTNKYVQPAAAANPAPGAAPVMGGNAPPVQVGWVSNGKLFVQGGYGAVQEISSPYAQQAMDRAERNREKNAWKKDTAFGVAAQGNYRDFERDADPILVSSARFTGDGKLLYFQADHGMGGLFSYDLASGHEERLLHRQQLRLQDMALSPSGRTIYCTMESRGGASHIACMQANGDGLRELTGGDTIDAAPTAVPGAEGVVIYQSAGIGRDQNGGWAAIGHVTLQELNTATGRVTPVLDDPRYDFLSPRVAADGALFFIRRPYEPPQYNAGNVVLDTILFPFRLLRALFHYLNFFSLMYSRKPLTGAGGMPLQADMKNIVLQGRRIDAERALRREASIGGVPSLVPASWQLVRRTRGGSESVVASNVSSFDITPGGTVVYSNGRGMFALDAQGRSSLLSQGDLVGAVLARDGQAA
ncbi:TolB family protein [Pseudoduganella sp.]|uniref:TolB family protein n=1 Tax=Pseudoduganella sp. TaxID=1880898 RepID=UPI0035B153AD